MTEAPRRAGAAGSADRVPVADEAIEGQVLAELERLGVPYEAIRIDPAYANTAAFCERYGYGPDMAVNCIVVAAKTGERRHAACLVQATRRLDVNGTVRRLLGVRKVSFAPADETVALTGMLPDGVTPFGLPPSVPVYVDAAVAVLERLIVGGGSRALKLLVTPQALTRLASAAVVEGSRSRRPTPRGAAALTACLRQPPQGMPETMTDGHLRGRLLVATPSLSDPNFSHTVVLILEHGTDGAVGVVLNRPSQVPVTTILPEWTVPAVEPPVVFVGGPVQREAVIALGAPARPQASSRCRPGWRWSTSRRRPIAVSGSGCSLATVAGAPARSTPRSTRAGGSSSMPTPTTRSLGDRALCG